eukprot:1142477-Pelagomonas_calceolata.AAC.5
MEKNAKLRAATHRTGYGLHAQRHSKTVILCGAVPVPGKAASSSSKVVAQQRSCSSDAAVAGLRIEVEGCQGHCNGFSGRMDGTF